jgi:hypothetical protein
VPAQIPAGRLKYVANFSPDASSFSPAAHEPAKAIPELWIQKDFRAAVRKSGLADLRFSKRRRFAEGQEIHHPKSADRRPALPENLNLPETKGKNLREKPTDAEDCTNKLLIRKPTLNLECSGGRISTVRPSLSGLLQGWSRTGFFCGRLLIGRTKAAGCSTGRRTGGCQPKLPAKRIKARLAVGSRNILEYH